MMKTLHHIYSSAALWIILFYSIGSAQSTDTLTFIHTSDCHTIFDIQDVDTAITRIRKFNHSDFDSLPTYSSHDDSLKLFFSSIRRKITADGIIMTGDLIEFYKAESNRNTLVGGQIEQFRQLCDESPFPLYLTLGNHCITTYSMNKTNATLIISQTNADEARASWIRNVPCFYNGTYYEKIFKVGSRKYHLLFLDNGYESLGGGQKFDNIQCDWINERVTMAGNDPVILFFHIYYAIGDINGDGIYFKENGPVDWPTQKDCSMGFLKIVNEHKNIRALVVGHGHTNLYEKIHFPGGSDVYQIETSSVFNGMNNWRAIRLTESSILFSKPGGEGNDVTIRLSNEDGHNVRK